MGCKINGYWQTGKIKFLFPFCSKDALARRFSFLFFFFLEKKEAKIQGKKIGSAFFPVSAT
jgi:hypothetical protein